MRSQSLFSEPMGPWQKIKKFCLWRRNKNFTVKIYFIHPTSRSRGEDDHQNGQVLHHCWCQLMYAIQKLNWNVLAAHLLVLYYSITHRGCWQATRIHTTGADIIPFWNTFFVPNFLLLVILHEKSKVWDVKRAHFTTTFFLNYDLGAYKEEWTRDLILTASRHLDNSSCSDNGTQGFCTIPPCIKRLFISMRGFLLLSCYSHIEDELCLSFITERLPENPSL